jgi:D,D-heptose 1,7-bisphosphate phosphatase
MKAVFLDRDGTINVDGKGYISKIEDFELYPFAAEAIKILNEAGFLVFVVTNQSGVARGYYTFSDLDKLHSKLNNTLAEIGARIDDIFISPYHIEGKIEPYNIHHEDRKPGLGMLKKAMKKYPIELKHSFMVGDRYSDIEFGRNGNLQTILVKTGLGGKEFMQRKNWKKYPHFVVDNLLDAAKLIVEIDNEKN